MNWEAFPRGRKRGSVDTSCEDDRPSCSSMKEGEDHMRRVRGLLLMIVIGLWAASLSMSTGMATAAQDTSSPPGWPSVSAGSDLRLTIYQNGFGLARETREFRLLNGRNSVYLTDIPETIDTSTIQLVFDSSGLAPVVTDYELWREDITKAGLLREYIGREIEIIDESGTYTCTLVSAGNDGIIVQRGDRIILNPPGTIVIPAESLKSCEGRRLVLGINSNTNGSLKGEVSYIASKLFWDAYYTGVLDKSESRLDISGWARLTNQTGLEYRNAAIKLVAGDLNMSYGRDAGQSNAAMSISGPTGGAGYELPAESQFFEYYAFDIPGRITLSPSMTKYVQLIPTRSLPVKKLFVFEGPSYGGVEPFVGLKRTLNANIILEFVNASGGPLPAGKIRIYRRGESRSLEWLGENSIKQTPKDERVELVVGKAFDVVGNLTVTDYRRTGARSYEEACSIKLRNHKNADVEVVVWQHFTGDWSLSSPVPYKKIDASTAEFRVKVPKDKEVEILYRVKVSG